VGTPERLEMLCLVSCADLAAVGPGVLNSWKIEVLFELYRRTLRLLSPNPDALVEDHHASARRLAREKLSPVEQSDSWFERQLEALPEAFVARRSPDDVADVLRQFRQLPARGGAAWARYLPDTDTVEFFGGVDQGTGRAIFSSMAGALSGHGMQILSAGTHTLADGMLLLHYVAHDPDYPGEPPRERMEAVCRSLVAAIDSDQPPKFRKVWGHEHHEANDLRLLIRYAKIGTYLDQVVDVFYVTERDGSKPISDERLEEIRAQLLEVIAPAAE
jgi:[protein-PII] uridylyltransferase